jgi:hypothetical protein
VATSTIVITYTATTAGKDAVVTGATVDGTEIVTGSTGTAAERREAWFLAKDLCRAMVAGGKFPAGVNGQVA